MLTRYAPYLNAVPAAFAPDCLQLVHCAAFANSLISMYVYLTFCCIGGLVHESIALEHASHDSMQRIWPSEQMVPGFRCRIIHGKS